MTEVDVTQNKVQATPQTRRSVLAKFIANFSGGVSRNTMRDSGKTVLAQVSANMDSRVVHSALEQGGHSTIRLEGSFLDMVPLEGKIENTLQQLPNKIIHITEVENKELLEEAPKPAVIRNSPSAIATERPTRVFHINVIGVDEEPGEDIKHWFVPNKELKPAA